MRKEAETEEIMPEKVSRQVACPQELSKRALPKGDRKTKLNFIWDFWNKAKEPLRKTIKPFGTQVDFEDHEGFPTCILSTHLYVWKVLTPLLEQQGFEISYEEVVPLELPNQK